MGSCICNVFQHSLWPQPSCPQTYIIWSLPSPLLLTSIWEPYLNDVVKLSSCPVHPLTPFRYCPNQQSLVNLFHNSGLPAAGVIFKTCKFCLTDRTLVEFYCDRAGGTGYLCLSYNFISSYQGTRRAARHFYSPLSFYIMSIHFIHKYALSTILWKCIKVVF